MQNVGESPDDERPSRTPSPHLRWAVAASVLLAATVLLVVVFAPLRSGVQPISGSDLLEVPSVGGVVAANLFVAEVCDHASAWLSTPFVVDGVLVYVDDIDAHFQRAQASGATVLSSLEDNSEVGQRQYRAEDLEGNRWMFAQPI